jgi:hypothetical protein
VALVLNGDAQAPAQGSGVFRGLALQQGTNTLRVRAEGAGFDLKTLRFTPAR